MKHKQITDWVVPNEFMNSEYGNISCTDWCNKERVRFSDGNDRIHRVKFLKDKIAVFRTSPEVIE